MLFSSNVVQVLATSSALLASVAEASRVIPLGKKNLAPITVDGVVQHDNLAQVVDFTRNKYLASMYVYQKNHDGQPFPGVKKMKGDAGEQAIQRRQQEQLSPQSGASFWSGNITIGGEPFRIDFDTGSADLWVPSINCTSSGCINKAKYDLKKTKTGKRETTTTTFNIAYADGSGVRGSTYTDVVTIAGLAASNQAFSAADFVETSLDEDPVDGILGMGYQSLSALQRPPFFQNLYAQAPQKVNYNQNFSFYLTEGSQGSELFLGGANPNKYTGPISYYPVINQAYWQIAPLSVFANSQGTAATGLSVIVDTGTTLVYAPNSTVANIFANVPGASHYADGYWQFPCDKIPTIGFRFSQTGPIFNFSSSSINLGRTSYQSRMCLASIVGQSFAGNAVLMGDAFLTNVYTVFNLANNTVGFAKIGPNANQNIPVTMSSVPVSTSTTLPPPTTTSTSVQTGTGVWTSTAASTSIVIITAGVGRPCGAARGTRTVCATPTATCQSLAAGSSTCKVGNVMTTTTSPVPQTTGTGVWKSTASATTIVITTASVGGRCGAAYGTRTVCATPNASCKSVARGSSTCQKANSTPIGLVSGDPFGGIWLSAAPTTTIAITTAVPSGRCGAAFGTRTVCVPNETCSSSHCRSTRAR